MFKISLNDINKLFAAFSKENAVYAPVKEGDLSNYKVWDENKEVCLTDLNTVKSPKDIFFPQSENLVAFKRGDKTIEVIENRDPSEPTVVFGVRACDLKGFEVLDKVFLAEPVDTFYQERRNKVAIVALACGEPDETCFCTTFGIDPTNPVADATAWIVDGELYLKANNEKGENLINLAKDVLSETKNFPRVASDVEHVHLYAQLASATISVTSTQATESKDSDAGIHVCIPISQRWLTETTETVR